MWGATGSAPDATRLPPGEQQKQRSAEGPEALQDLSSFLNGEPDKPVIAAVNGSALLIL